MDWWSRLLGLPSTPQKPTARHAANDPETRLARFKRVYHTILQLCNRPRNLATEAPLLEQLHLCLDRLAGLIREETRASVPHLCLQFASANQIYAVAGRAAAVSGHEGIISSTVSVFAALVDSEEEDFLSSAPFAKSLMRMVTKLVDGGTILINTTTETAILELLFTIAAKIRLQPEILGVWFQSTVKPELEDVFVREKKSFVGITQKEDFPLCYLLIDRVHHEGRIGDFARTGLLYIFEATGRSSELEDWVVSSDLPTLMASGLGALYSQLSRELSILHPDATLPAVLAMSDYSTTHPRATAESAFSSRHRSHMATFLSYLAFWQDVLDHCRSSNVKHTLLDHFQILFLRQLLYPSLLQSSDTDAGSSIAVLTYLTAMLESLDYPDLMHMMLAYLLAINEESPLIVPSAPPSPISSSKPPRSPSTVRRRQSLMLLTAPKDPDDAVEPILFNLVDLVLNNIGSKNSQSVFAALKLASTIVTRQKKYAFGTILKVQKNRTPEVKRTLGTLNLELEKLTTIAVSFHEHFGLDETYAGLCEDVRFAIEAQALIQSSATDTPQDDKKLPGEYNLTPDDPLLKALTALLRTFWTNSVDVNLSLTQAMVSIALCVDIRLDGWLALDPSACSFPDNAGVSSPSQVRWQEYLDSDEIQAFSAVKSATRYPSDVQIPLLYGTLQILSQELDEVRKTVPNLDMLISGRKNMLQAANISIPPTPMSEPSSLLPSPTQASFLDVPKRSRGHSGSPERNNISRPTKGTLSPSLSPRPLSPAAMRPSDPDMSSFPSAAPKSIFLPPPPETPSTTDVLMQTIGFPSVSSTSKPSAAETEEAIEDDDSPPADEREGRQNASEGRTASLNHVLTNVVVLQEFVLELAAVSQVRAAVLGEMEVKYV